jgi:hypothetical protein
MNHDLLDREARSAADAIHREVADAEVDAALAAVLAGPDVTSRRRLVAAAAAVVLLSGVAVAVSQRGSDPERVGTADAPPLDPADYGPVLATLEGIDDPGLRAVVHGPELLDDRDELAVAITGGLPGQRYALQQCVAAGPDVNPAASCTDQLGTVTLDASGAGVVMGEIATVFDGVGWQHRNDCRAEACELAIGSIIENDQPDAGLPGTRFDDPDDDVLGGRVPLAFAPDATAPTLPTMQVEVVDRDPVVVARLSGQDLPPGSSVVLQAHGYTFEPSGILATIPGTGFEEITTVEVAADGTFSIVATLPTQVTEDGERSENGVVQPPEVVTCADAAWSCQIWLAYEDQPPLVDGRPALVAPPLPYPAP